MDRIVLDFSGWDCNAVVCITLYHIGFDWIALGCIGLDLSCIGFDGIGMHCSAFTYQGTTNLMFGLSGTGKTT